MSVSDQHVKRAISARKIALDRGATEFEAMRFALAMLLSDAPDMIIAYNSRTAE